MICGGEDIFRPRSDWEQMLPIEFESYVMDVFRHYRKNGYPHQDKSSGIGRELESLVESAQRLAAVTDSGDLRFHMHGLGLAWTFQPHAIGVRCNGHKSVIEAFNDDQMLVRTIRKCLKRSESMSDNHFRETIRNMAGVQKPSNFRPMAAASVYATVGRMFGRKLRVWDMCGGYGGRMLGAAISGSVAEYVCNEPCSQTASGLEAMGNEITRRIEGWSFRVSREPAEDAAVEQFDLCFTSPPYFDTERYSEENTQSCVRYHSYQEWVRGFLRPVTEKACVAAGDHGVVAINVANTKRAKTLVEDTVEALSSSGLSFAAYWRYLLGATTRGGMKHEPVFVFTGRKQASIATACDPCDAVRYYATGRHNTKATA
jgi:hypothetical protein